MTATLGYVSNWQVGQWMAGLVVGPADKATSFVSLHTSDPGAVPDNPGATEIDGASYLRAEVFWVVSGPRVLVSTNGQRWTGIPEATVTHLGIFSDQYKGQLRAVIPQEDPFYVTANGSWDLKAGDLYLRWP